MLVAATALMLLSFAEASNPVASVLRIGELGENLYEVMRLDDDELEAKVAELNRQIEADPTNEDLYQVLVGFAVTRASRQLEADLMAARESGEKIDSSDYSSLYQERANAVTNPILERWRKNIPESCRPLLFQAQMESDERARKAILNSALERCPDDALVVAAQAYAVAVEGDFDSGRGLLEGFLDSHPKDAMAYEALVGLMRFGGRQADVTDAISEWRENLPDDLRAIQAELAYNGTHMDGAEAAAAAGQLLERDHTAAELLRSCRVISRLDLPQQTDACLERVIRLAGDQNKLVVLEAFGELISSLRQRRSWDRIEMLASDIPPEADSGEARIGIAYVLVEAERCATAQELIRELDPENPPKRINPSYWKTTLASIRKKCGDADQGASEMLDVFRTASLDDLAYLGYSAELEIEQAEAILLQRIEDGDDPAKVYEVLARIASNDDSPEKRLAYLEAWAFEAPDDPKPAQDLAWALKSEGALEPAIEAQREALRRAGDGENAAHLTGSLVSLLIEAEKYDEATSLANALVAEEDSVSRGRKMLAEVALAEGKTEKAIALYDEFLAEEPRSCYQVDDYLKLLRDQGRLEKIDAIVNQCSSGDEGNPQAKVRMHRQLVWMYAQLELYKRAVASLDLLLADNPEDNSLWNEKAKYLQQLGQWEEAEAGYLQAIRLAPRDEAARRGLAELYRMDGRWPEIVELLSPYIAERSSINEDLGLELARAQSAAGSPKEAAAVLERTVKENPKSFDAWFELGEVSVSLDRHERAIAAYLRFLELTTKYDKEEGGSCRCRCDVVDMRDEVKEALTQLQSTMSADKTKPASHAG